MSLGACGGDHSVRALEPAVLGSGEVVETVLTHRSVCREASLPVKKKKVRKCDGEAVPFTIESKMEHLGKALIGNV